MKALSLHQPWASLMAIGAKRNETRGRSLAHVGELAIHAAQLKWDGKTVPTYAETALCWLWHFRSQFEDAKDIRELYMSLPFGAVVCVVDKTGCVSTSDDNGDDRRLTPQECELGDYSPGRFYYPTTNLRRLVDPVRCAGKQGLFNLPPEVEQLVRSQLI